MKQAVIVARTETPRGSARAYIIGFCSSLLLTLSAYWTVQHKLTSGTLLLAILATLAIAQLIVQLVFFLHLGREAKSYWNLTVFAFMLSVLVIIVFGSLWIMSNLDYHHDHRTPSQTNTDIIKDEGIQPSPE